MTVEMLHEALLIRRALADWLVRASGVEDLDKADEEVVRWVRESQRCMCQAVKLMRSRGRAGK